MKIQYIFLNRLSVFFFSFILITVFLLTNQSLAATRTWSGGTSTDWNTATNWSGSVIPGTTDTVVIQTGTFNCLLAANTTVKQFTLTSDTIDLNGFTLTVSNNATITTGFITNGTLSINGAGTATFSGGTVSVTLNVTANSVKFSGGTFSNAVTVVKNSSTNSVGDGNCTFSSTLSLTDSGSGSWTLSNVNPDTYSGSVTVIERSTGTIYLSHHGTGNSFSAPVSLTTTGTGSIFSNYYGTATFHDSVIVNSTAGGSVEFGVSTGSCTLDTSVIAIGSSGFSSTGTLYLRSVNQNDSTKTISLTTTGTSVLQFASGCTWNGAVTASAPYLRLSGSRFLGVVSMTYTANNTSTSAGGCYFGNTTTLSRNATSSGTFSIGTSTADTFNAVVTIKDESHGTVSVVNAIFKNKVTLKNQNTESASDRFVIATAGTCIFKDSVTLDNTTSGMNFGNTGGSVSFDSSSYLNILSSYTGSLTFKNTAQHGSHAVSVPFQSNSGILYLNSGSTWDASFTANVQRTQLNGSTFNSTFYLKRTSSSTDTCTGGNIFNGTTTIIDSNATSHSFVLANTTADDFNGNTIFKQYGTNDKLYPTYTKNSTFAKDVIVDGSAAIAFGNNGGKVIFDGSGNQTLSKSGSYVPTFKRIQINKSGGVVSLAYPLTTADTLFLTKGVLATDTTNLLTVPDNGIVSGGSDSSYINGPLKKIGNDTFMFALGDTSLHVGAYHPLVITAPSNSSNEFTAKYYPLNSTINNNLDSIYISNCEYWSLKHNVGTDSVKVGLGWNSNSCEVHDSTTLLITKYNGTNWSNCGKSYATSNSNNGIINSLSYINITSSLTHLLTIASKPQLNFLLNSDTIKIRDTLFLTNASIGFNSTSLFIWNFNDFSCYDSSWDGVHIVPTISCADSVLGTYSTSHIFNTYRTFTLKLKTIEFTGDTLSVSKSLVVNNDLSTCQISGCEYISNGNFDSYTTPCPSWPEHLSNNILNCWSELGNSNGNYFTTEYYNTCAGCTAVAGIPCNFLGYQHLRGCASNCSCATSGGYIQVTTTDHVCPGGTGQDFRSYVKQQLATPLTAGVNYYVTFWVNLADISTVGSNIGMLFLYSFGIPITLNINGLFTGIPQIHSGNNNTIIDKLNWTQISGVFQAANNANWVMIGNFRSDANTIYASSSPAIGSCPNGQFPSCDPNAWNLAEYSIDDVSVKATTDLPITQTPNCTNITLSACTTLTLTGWTWYIGDLTNVVGSSTCSISVNPTSNTIYDVLAFDASGCPYHGTITVNPLPSNNLSVSINSQTNVSCHGGSSGSATVTTAGGTTPYANYVWTPSGGACSTCTTATSLTAGSYTCTVTDHNGCTASVIVTITEPSIITLSTSSTPSCTDNNNNGTTSVSVSGGTSGYTYSWSPALTCSTCTTMTDLGAGNYTVTVTDANGCTGQATVTVDPAFAYPNAPTIEGDLAACDKGGGDFTYTYTISNFASNSGTPLIIVKDANSTAFGYDSYNSANGELVVTWPNSDGGTIEVTFGIGCTTTTIFYVQACCIPVDGSNVELPKWTNETVSNIYSSIYNYYTGTSLVIAGLLVVDMNLTITGTHIYLTPGSKIEINKGVFLELDNCTIEAVNYGNCYAMWKGIQIDDKASLYIHFSNIYDAENALIAMDGSMYYINGGIFDRNYNCIKIPVQPALANTYYAISSFVSNTHFSGVTPLIPAYPGQLEYDFHPNAGIVANKTTSLWIGNNGNQRNIFFDHLNYGIIADKSTVIIDHSEFTDIAKTNLLTYLGLPRAGIGVYGGSVTGSTGLVTIYGNSVANSFLRCDYGVFINRCSASIDYNLMVDVGTGIRIQNNYLHPTVLIQNNAIYANFRGVDCWNNPHALTEIYSNKIYMGDVTHSTATSYPSLVGIDLTEVITVFSQYKVDNDNYIYLYHPIPSSVTGIFLYNVLHALVRTNNIQLNDVGQTGIRLTGGSLNTLQCNTLRSSTAAGPIYGLNNGIAQFGSRFNEMTCNHLDYTYRGFRFGGNDNNTALLGNEINNHHFGLELFQAAIMGVQGNPLPIINFSNGNQWLFNPYLGGNLGVNLAAGTLLPPNQIYYPDPTSGCGTQYFTNSYNIFFSLAPNTSCTNIYYCNSAGCSAPQPFRLMDSLALDHGDTLTILDSLSFPDEYSDQMQWATRKNLYEKLELNTALLSDSAFIDFHDSMQSTTIGDFKSLQDSMLALVESLSMYEPDLDENDSIKNVLLQYALYNDSVISSSLDSADIDSLLAVNFLIDSLISVSSAANDSILALITEQNEIKVDALQELNSGISASADYENNLQTVYDIYFSTLAKGRYTLDSSQQSQLFTIANTCPNIGGEAVPIARAFYYMINDALDYNDDTLCISDYNATDTCHFPSNVGAISGPEVGQCGQSDVSYSITPVSGATSYTWFVSDTNYCSTITPINLSSVSVDFADSLSIAVIYVAANNACGSSSPAHIIVSGKPNVPDTIEGKDAACSGGVEYYTTGGSTGATSYNWSVTPDDATLLSSNGSSSMLVLWGSNNGAISVTASNDCGESVPYSIDVTIISCRKSKTYSTEAGLQAYPNPTKGTVTIKFNSCENCTYSLEILDLTGRILKTTEEKSVKGVTLKEFDLSSFAKGIYFVKLNSSTMNEIIRITVE